MRDYDTVFIFRILYPFFFGLKSSEPECLAQMFDFHV